MLDRESSAKRYLLPSLSVTNSLLTCYLQPMSMILNLGISENWVAINWTAVSFPAIMRVDYVRIYQKEGEENVTCDPPGYETTEYIKNHAEAYNNPNYTVRNGRTLNFEQRTDYVMRRPGRILGTDGLGIR